MLEFRLRVATTAPLDTLFPDGGAGFGPWPEGGDGAVIQDRGKGMVGVGEESSGMISFALAKAGELAGMAGNYIAVGSSATGATTAFDLDYVSYKGIPAAPAPEPEPITQ